MVRMATSLLALAPSEGRAGLCEAALPVLAPQGREGLLPWCRLVPWLWPGRGPVAGCWTVC